MVAFKKTKVDNLKLNINRNLVLFFMNEIYFLTMDFQLMPIIIAQKNQNKRNYDHHIHDYHK